MCYLWSINLLISHKPYCKVETEEGWQIYDIVRHELLTEEEDKHLIMPLTYSRFNDSKVVVISTRL